ncbi:thiamine pyrophosphate-binding protein [Nonomuraea thailandensis]
MLGHGSTELGEVLRVYQDAGVVRTFAVRHETEASHAATALRWVTGEKAAVVTSIGPGALQAMAGSSWPPATAWASGTSTGTRPPRTRAPTCSRSRGRSRGCSSG